MRTAVGAAAAIYTFSKIYSCATLPLSFLVSQSAACWVLAHPSPTFNPITKLRESRFRFDISCGKVNQNSSVQFRPEQNIFTISFKRCSKTPDLARTATQNFSAVFYSTFSDFFLLVLLCAARFLRCFTLVWSAVAVNRICRHRSNINLKRGQIEVKTEKGSPPVRVLLPNTWPDRKLPDFVKVLFHTVGGGLSSIICPEA